VTFTWNPREAEANLKKHDVDFREAATVFDDPMSVAFPDPEHSVGEARFLIIGMSALSVACLSCHTPRWLAISFESSVREP
jgi:uncharacterized DUF497 family protein